MAVGACVGLFVAVATAVGVAGLGVGGDWPGAESAASATARARGVVGGSGPVVGVAGAPPG